MLEMRIYNRENQEFEDIKINTNEVEEFGIYNKKSWNKNGTFKKFDKVAYVDIKTTGKRLTSYHMDIITELKQGLKGCYQMSKNNDYEYKNHDERKCTNWTYRIK